MAILNIVIGVGGTGVEIINGLLKIVNRHPLLENEFEWFVLDLASIKKEFKNIYAEREDRFIKMDEFKDANDVVEKIKERFPDSNIEDIFPEDDYIRTNHVSNVEGGWKIRKVGYLSLIYHLIRSSGNILKKIDDCIDSYQLRTLDGIRVSVVGSLAGGTGSGIFIPLSAFLNEKITKKIGDINNFNLEFYNFLAMPDFLAKGSRKPQNDDIKTQFNANAYQGLSELTQLLSENHIPWKVDIDKDLNFQYDSKKAPFIKNVFLFHDINLNNSNLVDKDRDTYDTYLPYFQLLSWSLYFWTSVDRNTIQDIGNDLLTKNDGIYAGIGMYVIEYPLKNIVNKLTNYFYSSIPVSYNNISSIDQNILNANLKAYSYATDEYENNYQLDTEKKPQRTEYQRTLSFYNSKERIKDLRNTAPEIKIHPIQPYYVKYYRETNEKIEELLSNSEITISDLIQFLSNLYEKTKEKVDIETKKQRATEEDLKRLKQKIDVEKKHKKAFSLKLDYFDLIYKTEHNKKLIDLCNQIRSDLKLKMEYFEAIQSLLINKSSFIDLPVDADDYFYYPPPHFTYGDKSSMDELYDCVFRDILNSHQEGGPPESEEKLALKVLKNFWEEFSRDTLNHLLRDVYKKFNDMPLERRSIVLHIDSIKEMFMERIYTSLEKYIESSYWNILQEYNDLIKVYNEGNTENQYLASPFIPIDMTLKERLPKQVVVASAESIEKMNDSGGGDFKNALRAQIIETNNLVMFVSLIGEVKIEDLKIDHLKISYDKYLKDERNWYEYLDPQFNRTNHK